MRTDKFKLLNRIKDLYENKNINIIKWLKQEKNEKINDLSDILISYDFQAGTYINYYKENKQARFNSVRRLAKVIDDIGVECNSILDCGVGEATDLVPLLESVNLHFEVIGGFDLAWSRIKYAQSFIQNEYKGKSEISLFVGDMFNIPCLDNSFDIVFTRHALEPNRGKEKELLSELFRVTNKYLILIEPAYELASDEARKRMDEHGYIQNLYSSAKELGLNVVLWDLYGTSEMELNPSGLMIIEKNPNNKPASGGWRCPVTGTKLFKKADAYYSSESLLAYPVLGDVPLLTEDNAVVATKFDVFYDNKK